MSRPIVEGCTASSVNAAVTAGLRLSETGTAGITGMSLSYCYYTILFG
jgi:hypothetical protein